MSASVFYKRLATLAVSLLVFLLGLYQIFSSFNNSFFFSVASLFLFTILTVFIYRMGIKTVGSPNKNKFTGIVISAILGKLFLTLMLLFGFQYWANPPSKIHVVAFLVIYLTFTIFETAFMMRIAKPAE